MRIRDILYTLAILICGTALSSAQFIINPYAFAAGGGAPPTPEILWWKMNNGSGTTVTADVGPNGTTDAAWLTGQSGSGSSLDFNGTSHDAFSASTVAHGANVLTVCFWIYFDANATGYILESKGNGLTSTNAFVIYLSSGFIVHTVRGTTGDRSEYFTAPAISGWNHLAVIFDNTTATGDVTVYLNGAAQTLTLFGNSKTGTSNFATDTLYLAGRFGAADYMDGRMDDLRIYNRALSGAEITAVVADSQ